MLVRIKFTSSDSNRLNAEDVKKLNNFFGENVKVNQLKVNEDGDFESTSWRETFDKEKAEKDSDYKLVIPADMYQILDSNNYIVDLERFTKEFPNLEISIKGVPKSVDTGHLDMINEMNKIAEKIEDAKNRFEKVVEFNQRCEVHVPNLGLLNINKLAYATDYCTEELQRHLLQGWRILAICPQPDQRRPDYILGMHVDDLDGNVDVQYFAGDGREGRLRDKDKNKVSSF
jgi:hypothetical protein